MSVIEHLAQLGGVATRAQLIQRSSRLEVDRALASGAIVAEARGRYALPVADQAIRAAHRLSAPMSHLSAALHWGWKVKTAPAVPHVTLPRNRRLRPGQAAGVAVHRASLAPQEIVGRVTSKRRTLLDCLRTLPFDEALAVADSTLRVGDFTRRGLRELAAGVKGPGARQVRRVARYADGKAANPFESVLRALAIETGMNPTPQLTIGGSAPLGKPDLVDVRLAIVLEADSFEWHGDRAALRSDCRRYDEFVAAGFLVLRFAWEDVMHDPAWVVEILTAAVQRRTEERACARCSA